MTCEEANKVEHFDARGENFLIAKVADHKTSMTYGEGKLVLDKEVATWFKAFCDVLRPQCGSLGPTEPLFISASGGRVTNLATTSAFLLLKSMRQGFFIQQKQEKPLQPLLLGLGSDVQRRIVANLMGHSSKMADTYYTSLGDDSQCVEAYQTMGNVRRT